MLNRAFSIPIQKVSHPERVLIRQRRSVGEIITDKGLRTLLAEDEERLDGFSLELSGVNFNDITEDTLKKGKVWLKYYQKKEKRTAELVKKFGKEKQMLLKRQQVQMDRLLKDNNFEKTNEIKSLTQDHAKNPWETDEEFKKVLDKLDEKQKSSVEELTMHHKYETLKIEKIHKTEKFEHDRQDMKENHEYFKKVKKDAHEVQIAEYEQYQSQEVIELTKVIQAKQLERIAKLTVELKDDEENSEKLNELQEKLDKEALNKRKQLANTQEIRREQLVAEHKEQMKNVDQLYLKRMKDFELNAQSEIDMLERQMEELEHKLSCNPADMKSE